LDILKISLGAVSVNGLSESSNTYQRPTIGQALYRWVSTKIKGHPFEVITTIDRVDCAVLSDQVKSLDWRVLRAKKKATVTADVLAHVKSKLKALLQIA
jgi:mRNA interferase MazF